MSTPFLRRPQLQGNTDVPTHSQPYLQGTIRRDSAGEIPGFAAAVATVPADFVVETEATTSGPITITFSPGHSGLLTDILATLNAALSGVATAVERDGCVRLVTNGVGDTVTGRAFVRVRPATTDWNGDGTADDCADILGFYTYPSPEATAYAGDIESAATRPVEQGNPNGTKLIARGEDRLSAAFNRGLAQLSTNADILHAAGYRTAAYPVKIAIDWTDPGWLGRFRYDASGAITQISLEDLTAEDPTLSGRIYVAGLHSDSTLREIARRFTVTNTAGQEVSAFDDVANEVRSLRVAAVTRGENGFGAPTFTNEDSAPAIALPDTTGAAADGKNALGVDRQKVGPTAITQILNGTNIVCDSLVVGTGFLSQGVAPGDLLVIAGSTIEIPYSNNGRFIVAGVVSEKEIIVRPYADDNVAPLNESTGGSFGTLTVSSGGEWETGLWVTFTPPIARFPEDDVLVLTVGLERDTLNQRRDSDTSTDDASFTRVEPDLTGFEIEQLWQRQGLSGAYAGMATDRTSDAGSVLHARSRPVTILAPNKSTPSAGSYVRGPFTGDLLGNGILRAESSPVPPHPDSFTLADIGRVVKLSGGPFVDLEPYLITEFIDGAHIRIAPIGVEVGSDVAGAAGVEYEVYEDVVEYPNVILELVAPDQGGDDIAKTDVGILYLREQNNAAGPPTTPTRKHGQSLVHLERVSVGYLAGTAVDIRTAVITSIRIESGTSVASVGFSVESFQNIFAMEGGDARTVEPPYNGASVFRIFNGPNAGYYIVKRTYSTNEIKLVSLDGSNVLLDTAVATTQVGAFYNAHVSVGHTLAGKYGDVAYRTAKLRVFFDSLEQGEAHGVGLSVDWRGQGAGISAQLNDADFVAYDSGVGASGYLMDAVLYAPAHGINLSVTGAESGETERRSARGLGVSADGHQLRTNPLDWGTEGPEALTSWGVHVHQNGEDPAVIITKGQDIDAAYSHPTGAALQVRLAQVPASADRVYRASGTAIDVTGSVYLRRPFTEAGVVTTPGGAFYSETGFSAGQYVVPFQQPYMVPDRSGFSSFDSGLFPTQLGNPDQVYPGFTNDPVAEVNLLPPDSSLFAFHHIGVVHVIDDASFTNLINSGGIGAEKYVGTVLEIDDAFATGTITVSALPVAGDTIVIDGVVLTATTGVVGVDQFLINASPILTAANIAAAINNVANSFATFVTATSDGAVVTLFAVVAGESGADITLAKTGTAFAVSGSTLFSINGAYTVVGIKRDGTAHTADLAVVRFGDFPAWVIPQTYRTMRLFGRRWHQAYLNIADFALLGTWDSSAGRTELPAITAIDYLLNDTQFGLIEVPDAQFVDLGLLTYLPWTPATDGTSLGYVRNYPDMGDVDNTYADYAALSGWFNLIGGAVSDTSVASGEFFYRHPWATEFGESRSPFPNDLLFSNGDFDSTTQSYYLATGGTANALINDDYTVTFTSGNAQARWSPQYGGCLEIDCNGVSSSAKIWQRGRTYVMTAHLALRITVRIAVDTVGTITEFDGLVVGLCKEGGEVVAQETLLAANRFHATPRDYATTITLQDLYKGSKDVFNASNIEETLYPFVSVSRTNGGSVFILEIKTEQLTRPAIVSGPQKVAGTQVAHSYRLTDPIRGFQTIGPASADLLCGAEFGLVGSGRIYAGNPTGNATIDHIGDLEASGSVGSFVSAGIRHQPSSDGLKFKKGMHAATITLTNGVFDPVFYVYPSTNWATVDTDADGIDDEYTNNAVVGERFLLPGMTGFIMPLNPPHGSVLTTLSLNMSFRPFHTQDLTTNTPKVDTWGVYSAFHKVDAVIVDPTPQTAAVLLDWDKMEAAAGVRVEIWRHNVGSFQTDFPEIAEFSEDMPPFGFAERIFSTTISLADVEKPEISVNQVDPAFVPSAPSDVYAGTETFVKRTWRLQEEISFAQNQHLLRVDNRQYAYALTIRFYGGTRQKITGPLGEELGAYVSYDGINEEQSLNTIVGAWATPPAYYSNHNEITMSSAAALMYPQPAEITDFNEGMFPPSVKFRGARLGWITDRAGDGGWG
jgi:hypothetical protein